MEGKQLCESPAHPEPGCLSKKSLRDFSPSCFQNCKMKFCSIILQFCRCGGLWNAKGNPDGFLSHFSSLRNLRLARFFDSLSPAHSSRGCLSKKSLRDFSPSCFQNCKMKFCSIILQFCRCGGLWNAKGNPDGFLSHFSSLRNLRLARFFDSLSPAHSSRASFPILIAGKIHPPRRQRAASMASTISRAGRTSSSRGTERW